MSDRLALIIANSEFDDPKLSQLVTPSRDAEALAQVLSDPAIGGFDVTLRVNETMPVVRREIARLYQRRKKGDLLLLYYSGHGIRDEHSGDLYLATRDTEMDIVGATAIDTAFVRAQLDKSDSQRKVVVLDCCHSGAFAHGAKAVVGSSVGTQEAFAGSGYGRVVLTASNALEFAWEGEQLLGEAEKTSVFTHFLVQGLQTGAADRNGDGRISLDELYDHVYEQVITSGRSKQTPQKWAQKVEGEIIIAQNPHPVVKLAELPLELRRAIESPLVGVREGAVSELERLLHGSDRALALSAHEALTRLVDDDSRRVSTAATRALVEVEKPPPEEEPAIWDGLPIWGWGAIALMAALVIGGAIFLAIRKSTATPVPVVQATPPMATVTATSTPAEPPATPTVTSIPIPGTPTATWTPVIIVVTETSTSAPPATPTVTSIPIPSTPTATWTPVIIVVTETSTPTPPPPPTDIPTPVPPADTPTPSVPPGMVHVPAGEFIMGSSEAEVDYAMQLCNRYECDAEPIWSEQPQHTVYLDAFYIDKTEVTNAEYQQCVEAGVCQLPTTCDWGEPTFGDEFKAEHPVVCVRWHDARTYCEWADKRLPTEAEWEKAARGTDGRIYPWGNAFYGSKLNFCDANCPYDWKDTSANDGYAKTAPVGSYPAGASPYGALDMAGNVWEWVADWYEAYPGSSFQSSYYGGEYRVIRGGAWYPYLWAHRCAGRYRLGPWHGNPDVGFRCARGSP